MDRPLWITIIAIRNLLGGILGIVIDIGMLLVRAPERWVRTVLLLFSMAMFIMAIGLLKRCNWARWGTVVLLLGGLLTQITIAVFSSRYYDFTWWGAGLLICVNALDVWIVIYLLRPNANRWFLPNVAQGA
jgi:hypothetical protein